MGDLGGRQEPWGHGGKVAPSHQRAAAYSAQLLRAVFWNTAADVMIWGGGRLGAK